MAANILFVFSDQHRWCDLGCSGNGKVISPNLDRFAADGLRFSRCISNSPVCVPARGSLLTGLYPLKHGAITNDLPVRTDIESVADVLKQGGYHTGYIGKWHLGGIPRDQAILPERRLGFQEWKVCNCDHNYLHSYYYDEVNARHEISGYDAEEYTSLAVDFIRRNAERPWGLWLSWGPPHDPYFDVPQKYLDLYDGKEIALRDNVPEQIVNRLDQPCWTREETREKLKGYYAHITALDEQFGRLLAALEATGQLDNTLIVYTSDHGDQLGSQGWSNKQFPYEESIRVPLIARLPGTVRRGVCDELIGLTDLPVSLLSLLGRPLAAPDGRDLQALFREEGTCGQEACYIFDLVPCHQSMDRGTDAWRGVRTARYTYACHADGTPWILYDNEADPFQQNNRIDDSALAPLCHRLHAQTELFAKQHDALLPWKKLLGRFGLVGEWNRSQRHFGFPELGNPSGN
jgi:arylsulfatase A-like enzyme